MCEAGYFNFLNLWCVSNESFVIIFVIGFPIIIFWWAAKNKEFYLKEFDYAEAHKKRVEESWGKFYEESRRKRDEAQRRIDEETAQKRKAWDSANTKQREECQIKYDNSFYKILGLESNATLEEVKKAYKKLICKYHPDKVSSLGAEFIRIAHQKSAQINEAYDNILRKSK